MMTFAEFQATRSPTNNDDFSDRECYLYAGNLAIFTSPTGGHPYLEIANEFYQAPLEDLELILYGWALEEGYYD
jgi:hypothetical protein